MQGWARFSTLDFHDPTFLQRAQDDIGSGMDQFEWSQTLGAAEAVRRKILNWQFSSDCESVLVQIKPDGVHPLGRTDVISAALRANFANGFTSEGTVRISGVTMATSDAFKARLLRGEAGLSHWRGSTSALREVGLKPP